MKKSCYLCGIKPQSITQKFNENRGKKICGFFLSQQPCFMNKTVFILPFLVLLTLVSCTKKHGEQVATVPLDTLKPEYAQGFSIIEYRNYKEVIVYSPWKNEEIYARYYLVNDENNTTPDNGIKIQTPLKSLASTSVTHLEFLTLLNEIQTITGVCNPILIYNHTVQKNIKAGNITDLGDAFSMNVERTLMLRPQALMMSGFNQADANAVRVQQAGIPVIYNNEWMETSLLGRAEWIKFVAAFYNKEAEADTIFSGIEQRYNDMKAKASKVSRKPKIMTGNNFRGTWYMPGGNSFMGKLFSDAGADYFFANDTTTGSLPLNLETVLKNFAETDFWLNTNYSSIGDLIKSDSKHALFRPVKTGKVYNFNKRLLPTTANDFWESAVARPDLLLGDVIAILHPDILPDWEWVYAEKLKK